MDGLNTNEKQYAQILRLEKTISLESLLQLVFLGVLSIGFICYFVFRNHWTGIIFAHISALSIMGFYGCLAGAMARWKGYKFWKAFQFGFLLPIALGGISAFLLVPPGERSLPLGCGGWISLATGIISITVYSSLKRNKKIIEK